jgi:hypothetical protein
MHISDLLLCLSAFTDTDLLFRISSTNAVAPLSCKVSMASFTAPVTPEQDNIYIHNVCVHKYLYIFSTETHSLSPSWPEQAWEWWRCHQKTGKEISNKAVRITVHTWRVLIESGESNVAQLLWSLSNPWNLTQPPCYWIQSHLLPSVQWVNLLETCYSDDRTFIPFNIFNCKIMGQDETKNIREICPSTRRKKSRYLQDSNCLGIRDLLADKSKFNLRMSRSPAYPEKKNTITNILKPYTSSFRMWIGSSNFNPTCNITLISLSITSTRVDGTVVVVFFSVFSKRLTPLYHI